MSRGHQGSIWKWLFTQNTPYDVIWNMCAKFHTFITKCTMFAQICSSTIREKAVMIIPSSLQTWVSIAWMLMSVFQQWIIWWLLFSVIVRAMITWIGVRELIPLYIAIANLVCLFNSLMKELILSSGYRYILLFLFSS